MPLREQQQAHLQDHLYRSLQKDEGSHTLIHLVGIHSDEVVVGR